jgi:hypothetical protein
VPEAVELITTGLVRDRRTREWSASARSMLHNLNEDAIPIILRETLSVLKESGVHASDVTLPAPRRANGLLGRVRGRAFENAYVSSKRGTIPSDHVERILDGCRSRGIGGGVVRESNPELVVIDPS